MRGRIEWDFNFKVYLPRISLVLNAKENNVLLDYIIRILFFTYSFCMTMRFSPAQMEECKFRNYSWGITPRPGTSFCMKEITGHIALCRKRRYEGIMAHKKQLRRLLPKRGRDLKKRNFRRLCESQAGPPWFYIRVCRLRFWNCIFWRVNTPHSIHTANSRTQENAVPSLFHEEKRDNQRLY